MRVMRRKLFQKLKPEDYGVVRYAIVVYEKKPFHYRARVLSKKESLVKGYQVENIVIDYRCYLQIDLWLVVFDFTWQTETTENATKIL